MDNLAAPGQGSVAGIGASLTLVFMNNTTLATSGADGSDTTTPTKVNFGSGGLDVNATQFVLNVNLATSGGIGSSGLGMGGQLAANGSASWFEANTTTIAQIASGSIVTSDAGESGGAVNVNADDEMYLIGVGGAAAKGENIGIGVSIVVNDVTRTTEAIIGASIDPTSSTTPSPSTWNVAGPVTVEASDNGSVYSFALSGAVVSPSQPVDQGQQAAGGQPANVFGSWGLGISGDGVYNGFTDTTEAYINDSGKFTTDGLTVGALDDTELIAAAGAFTLSTSAPADQNSAKNGAISGSYAENVLHGATEAFIQNAQLTDTGDLSVTANRHNNIVTLACSIEGACGKPELGGRGLGRDRRF